MRRPESVDRNLPQALEEPQVSRDVLTDFAIEASEALLNMSREAARLAGCFRGEVLQEAHTGLVELTAELRSFPMLVTTLTGPLGVDPERLRIQGRSLDEQVSTLQGWLETIIDAHQQTDWLMVADALEWDLAPMLAAWAPLLRTCLSGRTGAVAGVSAEALASTSATSGHPAERG